MTEIIEEHLGPADPLIFSWNVSISPGEIPEVRCLTPVLDPTFAASPLWLDAESEYDE